MEVCLRLQERKLGFGIARCGQGCFGCFVFSKIENCKEAILDTTAAAILLFYFNSQTFMTSTVEAAAGDDIAVERSLFNSGLGSAPSCRNKSVPVIDMSQSDEAIRKQMVDAAQSIGFFTVVNHGIPQDLVDSTFQVAAEFFDQPLAEKKEQSPFASHLNSGFEFMSQVRPSTGTADQKETIQITAREEAMDKRWPTTPATFEKVTKMLMEEALKLAKRILTLLQEAACPELDPPGLIADSHELWGIDGQCTLRLLHYPPIDKDTLAGLITPDGEGRIHWRAGPHTDWCNVTLLFQKQAGLECCANPCVATEDTYWTPVDPMDGGIVVNIGDMLARWSDGKLHSNLHRVRMPEAEEGSRYSIGFFAQSNKSALIAPKNSPPMTAGEYILSRIKSNFAQ